MFLAPLYDQVVILCPEVKTGGPEALHQLGYHISRHGGKACMVYMGERSSYVLSENLVHCRNFSDSPMLDHFRVYLPSTYNKIELTDKSLLIYPEVLAQTARINSNSGHDYKTGIWWLSVDNAVRTLPQLMQDDFRRDFFSDDKIFHFCQSKYAEAFVLGSGAKKIFELFDYVDRSFYHRRMIPECFSPTQDRENTIAFFPRKGFELAAKFLETTSKSDHGLNFLPIHDMTKSQVREALFKSKIYIDFGSHPGKDRVPREAAIAGAVVLLHRAGAANFFQDHQLDDIYKFDMEDVQSGRLLEKVLLILSDAETHFSNQGIYRQNIALEYELFDLQVRSSFFASL